jgi:hypothetical protein
MRLATLLCFLAFLAAAGRATEARAAGRKVALVVGIDAYLELPRLAKARGDANAVGDALARAGFAVTRALDPDRRTLNRAVALFANSLGPDDTALLHFSGHGVEIEGENYLLPADAPLPAEGGPALVKSEALAMNALIQQIAESGARVRIFIIDACRDNPFARSGTRSAGSARGLTRVEAPAGSFIMYSAGYRQQALDSLGPQDSAPQSVYTRVLLKHLTQRGRKLQDVALAVRGEVERLARSAGHEQRPAYYDELSAGFVLNGPQAAAAPAPLQPPPAVQPRRERPTRTVSYHYLVGLDPHGDNFLALKEAPGVRAPRLLKMGPDTLLEVLDRRGPWLRVRTRDGATGWAYGRYIACCKTVEIPDGGFATAD